MPVPLNTFTADGRVVITFPESAVPSEQRKEFIAFLNAEWAARQSRFTASDAKAIADEVDSGWWSRNRNQILRLVEGKRKTCG